MAKFNDDSLMTFGKHKGVPLGKVPPSYLLWLFDKMMEDDDKARLTVYIVENRKALEQETAEDSADDDLC